MGKDYVRTARAKGLGEQAVLMRHALKNALLQALIESGQLTPEMIARSSTVTCPASVANKLGLRRSPISRSW